MLAFTAFGVGSFGWHWTRIPILSSISQSRYASTCTTCRPLLETSHIKGSETMEIRKYPLPLRSSGANLYKQKASQL